MNILALDTATEACSVALEVSERRFSRFDVCPQQHSQKVLPMIDEVLQEAEIELSSVDLLAFGRGPGSFTGVRIATGMIQGLALGSGIQVAGISTLQAMAQQAVEESDCQLVAAAIDARMGEVYFAVYKNHGGTATLVGEEQVCAPEEAAKQLEGKTGYSCVGTGWEAYEALTQCMSDAPVSVHYPSATAMLALAKKSHTAGEITDALGITPVYLRDKVTWKKLPGRE